jgi:hypothetical protein
VFNRRLGLELDFGAALLSRPTPASCTSFLGATVTGHEWQTPEGLRVGSTIATLRLLYPHAYNTGTLLKPVPGISYWADLWELQPNSSHALQTILAARTTRGHVVAIDIFLVGH